MTLKLCTLAAIILSSSLGAGSISAAESKSVTLNLGGKFCEFYPDDISAALKKLPGVQAVDAKQGQKFVVVQYDGAQVAPDKMVTAIKGVKQEGMWHCDATVK